MATRKRKKKGKLLKALLFGGGGFLVTWLLMGKKSGASTVTYQPTPADIIRKRNLPFENFRKTIASSKPGDVVTSPTGEPTVVTDTMISAAYATQGRG
jgi:hypothetical protein